MLPSKVIPEGWHSDNHGCWDAVFNSGTDFMYSIRNFSCYARMNLWPRPQLPRSLLSCLASRPKLLSQLQSHLL